MNRDRFKDLPFVKRAAELTVLQIGLGGIGSHLSVPLAKIGYNMVFYDDDTIEEHNLGGQDYHFSEVGLKKVEATLLKLDCLRIKAEGHQIRYGAEHYTSNIVVMAVDNMETRELAFTKWEEYTKVVDEPCIFIDGRMLAETLQVFVVTPKNIERYKETLFGDEEVAEQPCTSKATNHCGMLIAGFITSILTNWTTNLDKDIRDVPFQLSYNIPLLDYEIKN